LNIEHYISSGIIESYVLGLTTPEENAEVEKVALEHSEIAAAINDYRSTLESFGSLHAATPPSELKKKILDAIGNAVQEDVRIVTPVPPDMPAKTATPVLRNWKRLAAAAAVLLIVSLAVNGFYISKYELYKSRYTALVESQQQLVAHNQLIETRLDKMQADMEMLMNPAMKPVELKGVASHPNMVASLYWDPNTRKTYIGTSNLPAAPLGKDYQLWAIVDGKPVDIGLYHPKGKSGPVEMKDVIPGKVQAFAITLEKQGGSPTPTMEQMYVIGNI